MAVRTMSMDSELTKKLEAFQQKTAARAEEIVFKVFPKKILDLQELIYASSDSGHLYNVANAHTDSTVYADPSKEPRQESKKRKAADGEGLGIANGTENARHSELVYANKHIVETYKHLKAECEELARLCDEVSIWINLTMPKIEDGDNFGVAVQEEALAEVLRCQQSAYNLRDGIRQHHLQRAKVCSKLIKYPNIEDYSLGLKELDEKAMFTAKSNLYDLRNIYATMTNIFHKNIAKIRAPKGNNANALY